MLTDVIEKADSSGVEVSISDPSEERESESENDNPSVKGADDGVMLWHKNLELSKTFKELVERNKNNPSKKRVSKRKADDEVSTKSAASNKAAEREINKKIKYQTRKVPSSAGRDTKEEQKEKELVRQATKGLVKMFNLISKFQKEKLVKSGRALQKGITEDTSKIKKNEVKKEPIVDNSKELKKSKKDQVKKFELNDEDSS